MTLIQATNQTGWCVEVFLLPDGWTQEHDAPFHTLIGAEAYKAELDSVNSGYEYRVYPILSQKEKQC